MIKWQKVKLGDVCECLGKGKHPASFSDNKGAYPFIVSGLSEKKCNEYDSDDECFIIGDGGCANIHYVNGKYAASDHTYIFKSRDNRVSTKYIYKYLSGNMRILEDGFKGAGIKNISKSYIMSILIPLPPREEQERIAKELDAVADLLSKQKQLLAEQDTLIKSVFYDMFGDPVINDKGWCLKRLGDEFNILSGGTPSTTCKEYWENGTISWIGSNMCHNEVIYGNDGKYITEKGLKNSSAKIFKKDSVLVALVGATIGKVALLKFETTTNQNVASIAVHENKKYLVWYIFYVVQSLYGKFMEIGNGKFKMANLTFVRSLEIPVPPLPLQQKFADIVEQIEAQKQKIKSAITETETLFNALMAKYFDEE